MIANRPALVVVGVVEIMVVVVAVLVEMNAGCQALVVAVVEAMAAVEVEVAAVVAVVGVMAVVEVAVVRAGNPKLVVVVGFGCRRVDDLPDTQTGLL